MPTPSTSQGIYDAGYKDGLDYGRREGSAHQLRKLLVRLGRTRFGPPTDDVTALFDLLGERHALECLEALVPRVLAAETWTDWTAGLTPPEAVPAVPAYVGHYEFNPEPSSAGFDHIVLVPLKPDAKPFPPTGPRGRPGQFDTRRVIIHMRFQKWYEPELDKMMYKTSQQLREKHRIDHVVSILFLMFEMADGPDVTGKWVVRSLRGKRYNERFEYQIVRVFEKPPDYFYEGGPVSGMMAPLGKTTEEQLPEVIQRLQEVLAQRGASEEEVINFWGAAHWWMGLRYSAEVVNRVLEPVMPLVRRESGYQSLLSSAHVTGRAEGEKDGRLQATRSLILRLGEVRLGEPDAAQRELIESTTDLTVLERWAGHLLEASTWTALLA